MGRPRFDPKSTPSLGLIAKPHHLPHPYTRPTYDAKRLPDPIRRFSTMHWTDRRTHRPTDRQIVHGKVWWLYGRCVPRATRPKMKALQNVAANGEHRRQQYRQMWFLCYCAILWAVNSNCELKQNIPYHNIKRYALSAFEPKFRP